MSEECIYMVRRDLEQVQSHVLPAGFHARWYQLGDRQLWAEIWRAASPADLFDENWFDREFGTSQAILSQRVCFLFDARGTGVATGASWYDDSYRGERYGKIHYLAVVSHYRKKGLAKSLLSLLLTRLKELGHTKAMLETQPSRVEAVNLYRQFGFEPDIHSREQVELWRTLSPELRQPLDLRKYEDPLS
ncbi:MAG: GNAT family N-acetyltransferase [Chitinivibrionales bacterium]|nr:GNAT family N-acetyltransferase [Chitinivibrionales bacterium]MBD3395255.1 GNAT family N-acetyltransferase [Chitinivibrionales bacterium]